MTAEAGTPRMVEPNGDHTADPRVWDEIEETWIHAIRGRREKEDREAEEKYHASITEERETLAALFREREPLIKELARIDGQVKSAQSRITWKENSYRLAQEALLQQRERDDVLATEYYRTTRYMAQQQQQQHARSSGWPGKATLSTGPQSEPEQQHHLRSQPQSPSRPHLHENLQTTSAHHYHRPRSPLRFSEPDGTASLRQAEIALAALKEGRPHDVPRERRANGETILRSKADDTPTVGAAALRNAQSGKGTNADDESEARSTSVVGALNNSAGAGSSDTCLQPAEAANRYKPEDLEMSDVLGKTGVEVYDADGRFVGAVKHIEQRNPWIIASLQFPVRRRVEVRAGRKFGPEDLDKIYEPSDSKGTKWLSCIIQAAGDVQGQECMTCVKHSGVFSKCVIITGDSRFPRCANCEWARQACTGASLGSRTRSELGAGSSTRQHIAGEVEAARPGTAKEQILPRRSSSRRTSSAAEQPQHPSGGFTAVNGSATPSTRTPPTIQQSVEKDAGANEGNDGQLRAKKERKSLPGGRTSQQEATPGEDAPQRKQKGPRKSLPHRLSQNEAGHDDQAEAEEDEDTEEITKASLLFQDDGKVYTEPAIMRGVPVEKITPRHPYWEPSWPALEDIITPTLEKWQDKYETALVEAATQSSKYLANRQVNRGKAVLKYLREGPIHPLQIISKQYVTKKLFNYDTIHRLVQILDEFQRFSIDCTPTEWVRHRLHQKFVEKGDQFALDEEVDALYHDSKVRYIRKKSGFGNIGRPSGYRMKGEANSTPKRTARGTKRKKDPSATPETPGAPVGTASSHQVETKPTTLQMEGRTSVLQMNEEATSRASKPSSPTVGGPVQDVTREPSPAPEPADLLPPPPPPPPPPPESSRPTSSRGRRLTRPPTADGPAAGSPAPSSSSSRRASKRPKTSHASLEPPTTTAATLQAPSAEDLAVDGHTSVDSFSGDPIYKIDWRIYQVKTARVSSNPRVTQYYHWVDGPGNSQEASFEHQVLKDVIPERNKVTWGVFCHPYDFHLRLAELVHVRWARDSLKIVAVTREVDDVEFRGDLIVHFKRERTKRRFLGFLAKKKVAMVRAEGREIEAAWDAMESQVLSVDDDSE